MNRREFIQNTGWAAGLGMADRLPGAALQAVSLVMDPGAAVASAAPVGWAIGELRRELDARRIPVRQHRQLDQVTAGDLAILVADRRAPAAAPILKAAGAAVAEGPEAFGLVAGKAGGKPILLACANDARGAVYALLELADRVHYSGDAGAALQVQRPVVEKPANVIRSIARCFESDVEDKSWFYDREMWSAYLTMLAGQRFNRFSLTLGLDYNFPRNVTDVYFYFAYPFLLAVPGYDVRASGLADAERDRNLETLRFIGEQTVARGLEFQLGLWTHAYQWIDSPKANYTIQGLTPANHAAYCRDALAALLKACPTISGVTFRIHGESGIPEGNYSFWETLFEGVKRSGRRVEIDMHAKGMDQKMIDVATATGMPVNVSPKYWAEHMGLSYHQAAIRELEMPPREAVNGVFSLSAGSRRFLRYGYGDLLAERRNYGILHRIWPGTQRVLLWGDPAQAAGYGRSSSFCGSRGVELCEPLSFKGRMGSGLPGGRCAYADASLNPRYDWEKYIYQYRVWGRLIYNPETDPEGWRRYLRASLQSAAQPAEAALANASRVLPLITTAHGVSGSNNTYWPEIYTNMPIVDAERKHPYRDTPSPHRVGTVSPFDPELFSRVEDFAEELLAGRRSAKYSPIEVAQWLEDFSVAAARHVKEMESRAGARGNTEARRISADALIQSGLGRFFAGKLRSAVLWALYERSGDAQAAEEALKAYRAARAAWAEMANGPAKVYAQDITYGMTPHLRGHWLDRLPAIDEDLDDMEKRRGPKPAGSADPERVRKAVREVLARPKRPLVACRHTPPAKFRAGEPLDIELSLEKTNGRAALLHYRRVNQAELWRSAEMQWRDHRFRAVIPGEYTQSAFPLQYYFELRDGDHGASLHPGFDSTVSNQPYFVVRQA